MRVPTETFNILLYFSLSSRYFVHKVRYGAANKMLTILFFPSGK